jgi:hypothetical protein
MNAKAGALDERIWSPRMVLRNCPGETPARRFAESLGAVQLRDENVGSGIREMSWTVEPGLELHYAETSRPQACFVQVSGHDTAKVRRLAEITAESLNPMLLNDVVDALEYATDPVAKEHAILLAGLAAPNEFHPAIFGPLAATMRDPDSSVRRAGIEAVSFSHWPEFRYLLEFLADADPVEEVRRDARTLLRLGYEGIGEK